MGEVDSRTERINYAESDDQANSRVWACDACTTISEIINDQFARSNQGIGRLLDARCLLGELDVFPPEAIHGF
jgi:hypothetical protein